MEIGVVGARRPAAGGVAQGAVLGGSHATLLTTCGRCFTYGKGTALGLSKAERKSWELTEVSSFVGRKVLSVACGEYNTAFIVEA